MNLLDFAWVPGDRPFALGGALRASRSSRGGSAPFRKDYPLIVSSSTQKGRFFERRWFVGLGAASPALLKGSVDFACRLRSALTRSVAM